MVDLQFKDKNRFTNFKEILNEIRTFTSCPELLKSIDDEPINVSDEQIDLEDDDEELTKKLNSKLFNVLVGCGSSICDSESLKSDEFSSIFSSEEEDEDEFDKIVEQLQNKSKDDTNEERSSMPTLSSLFTCQPSTTTIIVSPDERIDQINQNKNNKINGKKVKFIQHQNKIKYPFSNESSLRLFDKIIKNNFHQKAKAIGLINNKFNSNNCDNLNMNSNHNEQTNSTSEHQSSSIIRDNELSILSNSNELTEQTNLTIKEVNLNKRKITKRNRIQNKISIKEIRSQIKNNNSKVIQKSKSEIFTLKPTTNSSTLKSFLNSIKSR